MCTDGRVYGSDRAALHEAVHARAGYGGQPRADHGRADLEAALQGETRRRKTVMLARLSAPVRVSSGQVTLYNPKSQPPGESKGGLFAADGTLMIASPCRTTSSPPPAGTRKAAAMPIWDQFDDFDLNVH